VTCPARPPTAKARLIDSKCIRKLLFFMDAIT